MKEKPQKKSDLTLHERDLIEQIRATDHGHITVFIRKGSPERMERIVESRLLGRYKDNT